MQTIDIKEVKQEVVDKMEQYKQEFIDFLPVHFYRPRECPQMLDFTGFEGIFNLMKKVCSKVCSNS